MKKHLKKNIPLELNREDFSKGHSISSSEDLKLFREDRSASPVGDWMRENLGLPVH